MAQSSRLSKLFDTLTNELPEGGPILIMRATNDPAYRRFDTKDVQAVQSFKPSFDALESVGLRPTQDMPASAKAAVVELTRSKPENLANVAKAYEVLDVGGTLFINGAKTDGIDSILKNVKSKMDVEGSYSKSHGKTIWVNKAAVDNPFKEWAALTDMSQNKDGFWTVPGIFSADAIDPASALLCDSITVPLKGKGADLGAGWGYLSQNALLAYPEITSLDLFEAEKNSLVCAQKNIRDERARFHWTDVQSMPEKGAYDFIIMNPPFHVSRKADVSLGRDFIAKASKLLAPKGRLWMVANKQLAYEAVLDANFNTWSYEEQTPIFKVIHARRPK
ncbi:class I SAM-dependent methyltransferase [Amylibacter sp. SFDW26]|uniref:class I SAM-dependent methyltransferase n=1 Tax=Amylibacter sp. SFDW26 TaxID=2652722 RepID=UPI00186A7C45|nr:methyltransferase [Amylibacter sp. SFDW26]